MKPVEPWPDALSDKILSNTTSSSWRSASQSNALNRTCPTLCPHRLLLTKQICQVEIPEIHQRMSKKRSSVLILFVLMNSIASDRAILKVGARRPRDRKSFVKGKSGSGRLDLGG